MWIIGCDLHTRYQQIAALDTTTGELVERRVEHAGDAVWRFYAALPRPGACGDPGPGCQELQPFLEGRLRGRLD